MLEKQANKQQLGESQIPSSTITMNTKKNGYELLSIDRRNLFIHLFYWSVY